MSLLRITIVKTTYKDYLNFRRCNYNADTNHHYEYDSEWRRFATQIKAAIKSCAIPTTDVLFENSCINKQRLLK